MQTPAKVQTSRKVGSVYGKAVTEADIGLTKPIDPNLVFDASDEARWTQMGRVMSALGGPVLERFFVEKKLDATADEIAAFQRYSRKLDEKSLRKTEHELALTKKELAASGLSNQQKSELEKERAKLEQNLRGASRLHQERLPQGFYASLIVPWKIERELYRTYGGRVIFQQFGLEALDGRRRLFEEAEKKGDLKIDDAGVRHLFYYYAHMKHSVIDEKDVKKDKLMERSWFFADELDPALAK